MRITIRSPIWGVEERVLEWNQREQKALDAACALLAKAREAVGPETDLGTDLGKGETILWEYREGALVSERAIPVEELVEGLFPD